MNEREWIVHSLVLCRERVKKFDARHEAVEHPLKVLQSLKWELDWREHIYKMDRAGRIGELSATGRIWWAYMQGHAKLQAARAEKAISEGEFHVKARALRLARDGEFREMKKGRVA